MANQDRGYANWVVGRQLIEALMAGDFITVVRGEETFRFDVSMFEGVGGGDVDWADIQNKPSLATTSQLATQTARIDAVLGSANGAMDTFIEVYTKFINEDSEQEALLLVINGKVTKPAGGTDGQLLAKSGTAFVWVDQATGGGVVQWADVQGKPTFFDGAYASLSGKPTIYTQTEVNALVNAQKSRIDGILASADGTIDTFLEVFNKFVLEDSEQAALLTVINGKLTTPASPSNGKFLGWSGGVAAWLDLPAQIPTGGTTNQVLAKNSNTNFDLKWMTVGGIAEAPIDGKQYARKDAAWAEVAAGASGSPDLFGRRGYRNRLDPWETAGAIATGTAVQGTQYMSTVSGSGASITLNTGGPFDGRLRGRAIFQTGTTTGRAFLSDSNYPFTFGSGMSTRFAASVRMSTDLSDATNTYDIFAGYNYSTGTTVALFSDRQNSAYFRYTHSYNGGKWAAVWTDSAGTKTLIDTGVTFAADTVYHLEIRIATDNTITWYINGTLVATATTPAGVASSVNPGAPILGIIKSAGASNRNFNAYYMDHEVVFP